VVALDNSGRRDFHRLQHYGAEQSRIQYFVFDLLVLNGRDLTDLPLPERRKLLKSVKPLRVGFAYQNNSIFPRTTCLPLYCVKESDDSNGD
jgi:ATP-dependent DNA ligase